MPTCIQCESQDFDVIDGHYYCVICSLQSQEIREEEAPELYDTGHRTGHLVSIVSTPKQRHKKVTDHGRPWRTCEGFQFIIKQQVKALIELGVNKAIQGVVFKLWTTYLSKVGEAFCENPGHSGIYQKNKRLVRQRDLYPGTSEQPLPMMVRTLKTNYNKQEELEKFTLKIQGEYDDEAVNDQSDDDDDLWNITMATELEEDQGFDSKQIYYKRRYSISVMKMAYTMGFINLGLLYTDSLYSPVQLVRLVNSGDVPYYGAGSLLPDDMKFTGDDFRTFNMSPLMTVELLLRVTARLAHCLGIIELPQPSIQSLTAKYLVQLNLPGVLLGPLHSFLENCDSPPDHVTLQRACDSLPNRDLMSVARVVALIGLVFGFHDDTLKLGSEVGQELRVTLNSDVFVWSEWFSWLDLEAHNQQEQSRNFQERLTSLKLKLQTRISVKTEKERKVRNPETVGSIQKPLEELHEKLLVDVARKSGTRDKDLGLLPDGTFTQQDQHLFNSPVKAESQKDKHKDFRKHSLDYILQPDICINALKEIVQQHTSSLSHDEENIIKKRKISHNVEKLVDRMADLQEKMEVSQRMWTFNEQFDLNGSSLSYYCLLLSLSSMIRCKPEELHDHVRLLSL